MAKSTGTIYMIKINTGEYEKEYIGQTTRSFEERISDHKYNITDMKRNTPLYDSMRCYGLNSCTFSVIEEVSLEELNHRECYWIRERNTLFSKDNKIGLNYKDGGNSNGQWSEALCEKQSLRLKAYYESEGAREQNRVRQQEAYADPDLREKHRNIRNEWLESDAGIAWRETHSTIMKTRAESEEGKARAEDHSNFMIEHYASEQGIAQRQAHSAKHKDWYTTPAGIAERLRSSERMKERQRAAAALIPERICIICNYKPAKNCNSKLTRHLRSQRHKDNVAKK